MIEYKAYEDANKLEEKRRWRGVVLLHDEPVLWTRDHHKSEDHAISRAKWQFVEAINCVHDYELNEDDQHQSQDQFGNDTYFHVSECLKCGYHRYDEITEEMM